MLTHELASDIMHRSKCGLCIIYVLLHMVSGSEGRCSFPDALYKPPGGPGPRVWITQVLYEEASTEWYSYVNVTVHRHELEAVRYARGRCEGGGVSDCLRTEHLYKQSCLQAVDGKYKVNHYDDHRHGSSGGGYHRCLHFDIKNQNLLLVKKSETHLCEEWNMVRSPWPWLAPVPYEWSKCPMEGGYDFRAYTPLDNRLTCDDFRPNRLESECVLGEGFILTYISPDCNPFNDNPLSTPLMCWANWIEDGFRFVIAGKAGQFPQFAFRLPLSVNQTLSVGYLYFSPLAPDTGDRTLGLESLESYVEYYRILIRRSESNQCYDESERCEEYKNSGFCTRNKKVFYNAKYCKKSCGLCKFNEDTTARCVFENEIQGDWVMFEKDRKEHIVARDGIMTFSSLGEFYCKGKKWNTQVDYKLFSSYTNGCRPRYTCLRMESLPDDNKAQYQISRSSQVDQSFDLCENLQDDPMPVGGAVRSSQPKLMIPKSEVQSNTCGLGGWINVTMGTGDRLCRGTVSDYDVDRCGYEPQIKVNLRGKCSAVGGGRNGQYNNEFSCESYINLAPDYSMLITRSTDQPSEYKCWVIRTFGESMGWRRWRQAFLLDSAQCGWPQDLDTARLSLAAQLNLVVHGVPYRPCSQRENTGTPMYNRPGDVEYPVVNGPHKTQTQPVRGLASDTLHLSRIVSLLGLAIYILFT